MAQSVPFSARPEGYLVVGVVLAVLLGVLSAIAYQLDAGLGVFALWLSGAIAGTFWTIGLIGKAVEVGVRAANRQG